MVQNRILETNPCIYDQMIFDKGVKTMQQGMDNLFNNGTVKTGYPHVEE